MNSNATVNVRVSKEVKAKAESVLKELNISMSGAIDLYLREIAFHRGLPFAVRIPNDETVKAMQEVESSKDLEGYSDADEMFQALGISQ
ncbi:MAG: type II toxin-antitoxin system RelB/DinJ family antitoxin [Candidatus Marinimicrobia bacterium]|nr:type II toxin-antitoxin system RelB/DinJ family antitoxin [Candidatus Neomarinimicrobiota bacterium]